MQSSTKRLSIVILLLVLISIAVMGNPNPEQHDQASVMEAIQYLQNLEKQHGMLARPR
jgi:hypothetical protein